MTSLCAGFPPRSLHQLTHWQKRSIRSDWEFVINRATAGQESRTDTSIVGRPLANTTASRPWARQLVGCPGSRKLSHTCQGSHDGLAPASVRPPGYEILYCVKVDCNFGMLPPLPRICASYIPSSLRPIFNSTAPDHHYVLPRSLDSAFLLLIPVFQLAEIFFIHYNFTSISTHS